MAKKLRVPTGSEAKAKPSSPARGSCCRLTLPGRSTTGAGGDPPGATGWDTRSGREKKAWQSPAVPARRSRRPGAASSVLIPAAAPAQGRLFPTAAAPAGGSGRPAARLELPREEEEEEEEEGSGFPTPRLHLPLPRTELLLAFLPHGPRAAGAPGTTAAPPAWDPCGKVDPTQCPREKLSGSAQPSPQPR